MASDARPFASFGSARAFAVGVTTAVWTGVTALLGLVFGGMLARPDVSDGALRVSLALFGPFAALLAAHGVVNGMTEAFALGRLPAPPSDHDAPADPWRTGLLASILFGLPVGFAAAALAAGPVSSGTFTTWAAATGAAGAGLAAAWASGTPVARGIAAVARGARWTGTEQSYRIARHALPNGLLNGLAGALAGLAMAHPLPADAVAGDAAIGTFVVGAAASFGARDLARADARRGWFRSDSPAPSRGRQLALCAALAVPAGLAAWAVGPVSAEVFVAAKGLWSAGLAASLAYVTAGWGAAEGK
jgi:hypothetical protein